MNELANIYRGKSFSIGFTIPDEYDESRIEDLKVNIGTKVYQHTIVQGVIGVNLTSNDTAKMVGRQDVVLTIEDSLFGVQKLNCGYVYVSSTISKFQSESFSDVYDVMVMLSFYSERLSVDHVLFDYLKGKSAYEYAVEGGYLGTEEQFYLDLAKAAIAVPYTGADKDVDLGENGITVDNVIFNENPVSTIDPLKLQYNPAEKTIEFGLKDGGILQLGKEMFEEYTNIDTVALTNGMIVSTAAISGNRKGIKRTDFTSLTSIRSIVGMVTVASIGTNQSGRVTTKGIINELNTNGIGEGSQLWGNPSVLGGWSGNKPAKPQYAVQIGQVVVASATVGSVELNIAKDVKFSDLADVNGSTSAIDDTDTIPKRDADGIIREISVADIKADFKADTDLIYEPLLGFMPEDTANKGQANGYASLGADGLVPSNQLPSFVDDVLEFANLAAFPATGETGKIYVALDTNKTYRWSGSTYIYITSGAVDSVAGKTGVVTLVKADVGLGNVDNTSDVNKPVSTAQQNALDLKIDKTLSSEITTVGDSETMAVKASDNIWKRITWSNIKATLKTYFETLFVTLTGAQNIAGVKTFTDSPVVPTPVNNTDAANKAYVQSIITVGNDTYQENKLITDARVASLENTINSANINQETTATVTGVDTIALPKTAANTGMQVQMFGQSAQNLVVNGDFSNGTTGWLTLGTPNTMTITDKLTLNGTAAVSAGYYKDLAAITGDKLYIAIKSTNAGTVFPSVRTYDYNTTNNSSNTGITNTVNSVIVNSKINGIRLYFQQFNGDVYNNVTIDDIRIINLSATFGAGNEPTKEQCDILFANYFEGSDNVLGTGRVRSVGNGNIFNPFLITRGLRINTTTGLVTTVSVTDCTSSFIKVNPSTAYRKALGDWVHYYDINKQPISGGFFTTFTTPSNCHYIRFTTPLGTLASEYLRLSSEPAAFTPYKDSSLYFNGGQLRSNGLIKDEIRKGTNGYELVKRVGVGTLGADIITNGTFDSDTAWNKGTGWTISGGVAVATNVGSGDQISQSKATIGKWYKIVYTLTVTAGSFAARAGAYGITRTASGTYSEYLLATNANIGVAGVGSSNSGTVDNYSAKEVTAAEAIAATSTFTEIGSNIHYTLATPTITPIAYAGLLNSNSNGTAYFEPIIADAGVYSSNLAIQLTDYPIATFESIRKYANGTYTELNTATAVIASGGLSFTHPDLVSGDLVMFTYAYNRESIGRSMTLTHYDSRFVKADTANGKVYRWGVTITNGVPTLTVTEV